MALRSWLFVPADSEKKLGKALGTGADAVILDLEDAVAPEAKGRARELAFDWLKAHRTQILEQHAIARWVRINPLDSRMWRDDLVAVMPGAPDGIILPKASGPDAIQQLGAEIYELEQRCGVPTGSTKVIPLVGETAASAINITDYVGASLPRLAGLTWGAEDLAAAIGATRSNDGQGRSDAFRFVRAQTLLAAHARGIMAIDTVHPDFNDPAAIKVAAAAARADGFTGMLAIHPVQVGIINQAFTPSEAELAEARAIVAAFEREPGAGALQIDRRLIDRPHLVKAQRLLGVKG